MTGSHPIKKSGRVPLTFTRRAGTVPVKYAHKHIRMGLGAPQRNSNFVSDKVMTIVKTLLNNLWTHIGHEDDGHLVHTDKRTGMQFVSVKAWPSLVSARLALDAGFSKIEWEELKEPPPAA
jgi:hypothetical protein